MLLEVWQASCWDHFSGELSLVIDHPLSEIHLPNIQPEFSHMQFNIISMPLLLVTTLWVSVDSSLAWYQSQSPDLFFQSCPPASQFVRITGTTSSQMQNSPLALVTFHPVGDCPALWPTGIFKTINETQLTYWFNLKVKRELWWQFAAGFQPALQIHYFYAA